MSGLFLLILGLIMLFVWNFRNKLPYQSNYTSMNKQVIKKATFSIYLITGVFFVMMGFIFLFLLRYNKIIKFLAMALSFTGIFLLIIGLYLFLKYIFFQTS
ncbi:MAG: hypothetical protein QXE31_02540 [Candidatus Woesearchaeota archaeon]